MGRGAGRSRALARTLARRADPLPLPRPPFAHAELGIDIPAILSRTRSILTFRLGGHDMDTLDLGGPLIFMALLGAAHLLVGCRCCCTWSAGRAVVARVLPPLFVAAPRPPTPPSRPPTHPPIHLRTHPPTYAPPPPHTQVGKLHFGYILGWTVVGSMLIWFVLNIITGSDDPGWWRAVGGGGRAVAGRVVAGRVGGWGYGG